MSRLRTYTSWLLVLGLSVLVLAGATPVFAATNISATPAEHYAWNDILGWFNFYSTNTVTVTNTRVEGYASSAAGDISLDCATTSAGNICGSSNYYVTNNGVGVLAGFAWNDTYGWISFSCTNNGSCGTSSYGVTINPSTGVFTGYAWNDVLGWISFNCSDIGICGTSDYKVDTSWYADPPSGTLDSTPFDTGVTGAQVNSITWTGVKPVGTDVRLQVATSPNSNGPWNYYGPDGTVSSYYTPDPDVGAALYPWIHAAGRYFSYRVTILSENFTTTPRVDDVVVRWSP